MEFEYDPAKSASNKPKHGIDFEEAQRLWDAPTLKATTYAGNDDQRSLHIGVIDGKHWSAITTERNGKLRIISVRRSRTNEKEAYDERINEGTSDGRRN